ncbi:putative AbiEii toxin of type IV toxin-antitoxin system [Geothermobacter ehrlichii]|uniref:Putative AbiEii toxin of type IV toxin-antitoxin system n=1 Tax=Geothermobacter ehrlichii TaxID=213224 RepID=A0A5D3WLT3_9BACT|nr:AAA family ATPase [Geothermobacter ehrlichii]TYO99682.1 putative AbiEii toxin of type IV toxin-antitoxin system [Geothermobacter ehrlichii]
MIGRIIALTIENFKGISDPVRIEFAPITLLFGANSAGKSTIIQALHYMREILEHGNLDADNSSWAGETLDFGGFRSLVNGHDLYKSIRIRIDFTCDSSFFKVYPAFPFRGIDPEQVEVCDIRTEYYDSWFSFHYFFEIEVSWDFASSSPCMSRISSGLFDEKIADIVRTDKQVYFDGVQPGFDEFLKYVNFSHEVFCSYGDSFLQDLVAGLLPDDFLAGKSDVGIPATLCCSPPTLWDDNLSFDVEFIEELLRGYSEVGKADALRRILQFESYLTQLIRGPADILLEILQGMAYVGPIRKTPERYFVPRKTSDPARWATGLAAWDKLFLADQEFIDELNRWLAEPERLGVGYKVEARRFREIDSDHEIWSLVDSTGEVGLASILKTIQKDTPEKKELSLLDLRRGCNVLPHDIGIGISQMMPVLIAALDNRVGIAAIEQPELHVHPGLQCRLADLFILSALRSSYSQSQKPDYGQTQFLLETHSEHLLLRLLRRIRETTDGTLPEWHCGLKPEHLSINFIDFKNGKHSVRRLQVSDDGDSLGDWPDGFFEERAEELF